MSEENVKSLQDLVDHLERYPEQAFLFIREGLKYAADKVHGEENEAQRQLHEYLALNGLDFTDIVAKYYADQLPEPLTEAIKAAGGCEKLNRHVSGRELCWGLRDYALERWGMLARPVLEHWNVRSTRDFGKIVFGFIEFDMMQQQVGDTAEDFAEVYSFEEAFDETFRSPKDDVDPDRPL